jgi:hypothetical protein
MQAADLHRERRSDAGREGEGRDAMSSTKAGEKVEKASSARSHTERERGKAKMELHQDKALHREQAMEHMVNDGRLGRALFFLLQLVLSRGRPNSVQLCIQFVERNVLAGVRER